MTNRTESGRYSIAGFLYQIVGSASEGFRIAKHANEEGEILELEQLGQDLVVRSADDANVRLIQFKYSSTNSIVNPNEMRKILQTFLDCLRNAKKNIADCKFELRTNRELHPDTIPWFEAKRKNERSNLRAAMGATSNSEINDLDTICDIFEKFTYHCLNDSDLHSTLVTAAAKLGMLESEIPDGVNRLVGFLAHKSAEAGDRRVSRTEIRSKFAGHPNACELFSVDSIKMQIKDLEDFQQDEACKSGDATKSPIVRRSRTADIVGAILQYPVVVVHGDGGCGKSIAVADALLSCLHDRQQPPGFCMISRADSTTPQRAISKIAKWRNCNQHSDGQNYSAAISRLKSSYNNSPVLVMCFDAIDEKTGETLTEETLEFIRDLIRMATESRASNGTSLVSVLLTCRRKHEVDNIPRNINPIAPENNVTYINIDDYDNDEMVAAASVFESLDSDVVRLIGEALGTSTFSNTNSRRSRVTKVDASIEVIESIRHPVLWYVFSQLTHEQQLKCIEGGQQALHYLGKDYLAWFRKKAACRIKNLQSGECELALCEAAKTFADENGVGCIEQNWLKPVADSIGNRLYANRLFHEAVSAGLIVRISERERLFRWRHPWFCKFLVQNEGDLE